MEDDMKSLHRQRHSRIATAAAPPQHQLQLTPCDLDDTGRQLHSGSCTCGEMTPTPAWGIDEIHHAHALHIQMHSALLELRRVHGPAEQRKDDNR